MKFSIKFFDILFVYVYICLTNLFMSRYSFMYGTVEIADKLIVSVNFNLRGLFIFMVISNAG